MSCWNRATVNWLISAAAVAGVLAANRGAWAQQPGGAAPTLLALPDIYAPAPVLGTPPATQAPSAFGVQQATAARHFDPWGPAAGGAFPAYPPASAFGAPSMAVSAPQAVPENIAGSVGEYGAFEQSFGGECCDPCAPCAPCPPCRWFGGLYGLYMGRDNANKFWTSAQANNNPNQVLNTGNADTDFTGGFGVSFGSYFGCPTCDGYPCAIMAEYWTLAPWEGFGIVNQDQMGFFFNTPIDLSGVTIGGQPASNFFDGAESQFVSRQNWIQNVEINFWKAWPGGFGPGFQMGLIAGVRYFRFNEDLLFGSLAGGGTWGGNSGLDEAYLDTNVVNNLIGFQIGTRTLCPLGPRWGIYFQPLFGVFGNHIEQQMSLYQGGNGAPGFDLHSSANDVSLLGQLDLGVQRRFGRYCSAYAGYRVLGISGIALADNQLPAFLVDTPEILDIDSNGDLIVHGGVFGLMFNY